mgnify:CR=1 FL=1
MNFKYMRVNFTLFLTLYICIVLFFSIISYNFFISDYIKLENKQNLNNIKTIISSLNISISNIKNIINDYSKWDDSYEFIKDENKTYIYENFREGTSTLDDLNIDFIVYSNLKQKTVFSKYSNDSLEKDKIDFEQAISNFSKEDTVETFFKYKSSFLYLIKSQIKKSDKSGSSVGYIYSGKLINNNNVRILAGAFKKAYMTDKNVQTSDFEYKLFFQNSVKVKKQYTSSILFNNIQVFDIHNNYVFSMITESERDMLMNGQKTIVIFNLIIAIFVFVILFALYKNQKILQRLIEKKSQELIEKQKIIAQQSKMIAMSEILDNIAHQWRQPLSVITTASSGVKLNKEMGILDEESLFKSMDVITEQAVYLSNTISDFQNFQTQNKRNVNICLSKTIEKTISLMNLTLVSKKIKIIQDIQNIKVLGIENELMQVFLNVLNNSIDAFEKEKIENKLIVINISKQEESVVISIKDNAGGISEDIIERVFEPYFTTKHKSQGTGIGLYMSYEIICKHMKGKFFVENSVFTQNSTKHKGTNFTIILPLN